MKITESDRFPPTIDPNEEGDIVEFTVSRVRYVNTKMGELPILEMEDVRVFSKDCDELEYEKASMWISRKALRQLAGFQVGTRVQLECFGRTGHFKAYEYQIKILGG